MSDHDDAPKSPKSPSAAGISDEAMGLQLQQFFDDWYYRFMSSSLGKTWNRDRVVGAGLDMLILNGCELTPEERQKFPGLSEAMMIDNLVDRMPDRLRDNFEDFTSQMQEIMQKVTRVRKSLEGNPDDPIAQVIEEIDGTPIGQNIMQMAVVVASKEVAKTQKCQATWTANAEKRLNRLQNSAELAERCQQQLMALESQLESLNGDTKSKGKSMLMNMADSNDKTLLQSAFANWMGLAIKERAEKAIRKKFEDEIEGLESKLFEYKEKQLTNVRNTMIRTAKAGTEGLLATIITVWQVETKQRLRDGDNQAAVQAMEDRLKGQKGDQAEKSKQAVLRLCGNRDTMLVTMVFQGIVKFHEEYQKDKEMEDAVKKAEAALKAQMADGKEQKKKLLSKMAGGTDSSLVANVINTWGKKFLEDKEEKRAAEALAGPDGRFNMLKSRQSGNARGVQGRVNEQQKLFLIMNCYQRWATEAKVQGIQRYYTGKLDSKRRQLDGVKQVFKSFSQQLDAGLSTVGDGDSSGRGERPRKGQSQKSLSKNQDTVSLPDIRERPVVA